MRPPYKPPACSAPRTLAPPLRVHILNPSTPPLALLPKHCDTEQVAPHSLSSLQRAQSSRPGSSGSPPARSPRASRACVTPAGAVRGRARRGGAQRQSWAYAAPPPPPPVTRRELPARGCRAPDLAHRPPCSHQTRHSAAGSEGAAQSRVWGGTLGAVVQHAPPPSASSHLATLLQLKLQPRVQVACRLEHALSNQGSHRHHAHAPGVEGARGRVVGGTRDVLQEHIPTGVGAGDGCVMRRVVVRARGKAWGGPREAAAATAPAVPHQGKEGSAGSVAREGRRRASPCAHHAVEQAASLLLGHHALLRHLLLLQLRGHSRHRAARASLGAWRGAVCARTTVGRAAHAPPHLLLQQQQVPDAHPRLAKAVTANKAASGRKGRALPGGRMRKGGHVPRVAQRRSRARCLTAQRPSCASCAGTLGPCRCETHRAGHWGWHPPPPPTPGHPGRACSSSSSSGSSTSKRRGW